MTTTQRDTTDTKPRGRQAPRQRGSGGAAARKAYDKARTAFAERAQQWLRGRPERTTYLPENLHLLAALGVPCSTCGALIYRDGDAGHTIELNALPSWFSDDSRSSDQHWSTAVTASCV